MQSGYCPIACRGRGMGLAPSACFTGRSQVLRALRTMREWKPLVLSLRMNRQSEARPYNTTQHIAGRTGRLCGELAVVPRSEPSYTDLAYEVLRSAARPLTFEEVFDEVNRRRPVTTRHPRATIRGALGHSRQLVSLGDGRYGYLPHLVAESLLRVPLTQKKPAAHPLIFPDEARQALWPSFFEIQKRTVRRPFQVRLASGQTLALTLDFLGGGVWGSQMPEELRRYLVEQRAAAGDSLLVRVHDPEAGQGEAWLEPARKRDQAAVARRNREIGDAVERLLRAGRSEQVFVSELVIGLLARGLYRAEVAPDSLKAVLQRDGRFVEARVLTWTLAENVTPDMLAAIRERKRWERELFHLPEGAAGDLAEGPSVLATRRAMERTLADVGAMLAGRELGSTEAANTLLQDMLKGGRPLRRSAGTALEQAQDLMYDAWEAPDLRERVRLANEALRISPDCADAYVLLAEEMARSLNEEIDLFARGVAAGERALGKQTFERDVGHFWGLLETRPYMRARLGLANALWDAGRRQEAVSHARDMLRLNPGDNQGVRYHLLSWLLELGEGSQVTRLLDEYAEEASAFWLYASALQAFRLEGDTLHANTLLANARKQNPYVPAYLLGKKRLPSQLPDTVGFGDEREAIACAADALVAWRKTPGALAWLADQAR